MFPWCFRNARFCHFSVCSQFLGAFVRNFGWVFAVLFEVCWRQIQEEIHHVLIGRAGGRGAPRLLTNILWTTSILFPSVSLGNSCSSCPGISSVACSRVGSIEVQKVEALFREAPKQKHLFWGIQIDYRQTLSLRGTNFQLYRYRIALPEELISITETDLWKLQQKISYYRYRFSLEFQLISITDTDFGLKRINSVIILATMVPTRLSSPLKKG